MAGLHVTVEIQMSDSAGAVAEKRGFDLRKQINGNGREIDGYLEVGRICDPEELGILHSRQNHKLNIPSVNNGFGNWEFTPRLFLPALSSIHWQGIL